MGFVMAQVAYLLLPLLSIVACAGIVLRADLLPTLKRPIDGNLTFRGRRLFGDHKTWRGAACALAGGLLGVAVQKYGFGARAGGLALLDYEGLSVVWLGGAFAAGAVLGELLNSFIKRQLGIPPGCSATGWKAPLFYVLDQVDVVPATWLLLLLWIRPTPLQIASSFVLVFIVHQLVSVIGFKIGARTRQA